MKTKLKYILAALWVLGVLILGTFGYMQEFDGYFWKSLYCALMLFVLSPGVEVPEMNVYIITAAFMASLTLATFLITLVRLMRERMHLLRWMFQPADEKVAIHTNCVEELVPLLKDMEKQGKEYIISDLPGSFSGSRQLLFFSEYEEMFEYITKHREELSPDKNRDLYVYCEERDRDSFTAKGLHNICLSQNAARIYWQEHMVTRKDAQIVMIGFGNYGEALLEQALLTNVISTCSEIEYHIFPLGEEEAGRMDGFLAMHPQLEKIVTVNRREAGRDSLWIHKESFYKNREILEKSRIILAADKDETNIAIMGNLQKLFALSVEGRDSIDIRLESESTFVTLLADSKNCPGAIRANSAKEQNSPTVQLWGNKEKCMTYDIIFSEKLLRNAKIRDAYYRSGSGLNPELLERYHLTPEQVDAMSVFEIADSKWYQEIWNSMSLHMQGTNLALADHTHYKLWLMDPYANLKNRDIAEVWDRLPEERKDELGEIEHIRWMRFHYMNNWSYGPEKDFDHRTHPLLLPYDEIKKLYQDPDDEERDAELKKALQVILNNDRDSFRNLGAYLD